MSNTRKELNAEQKKEAPSFACRYCGGPVYWELLPRGKKRPVNATDFEAHYCNKRPKKEVEMPTNKGHCKHGESILAEGCPQCIEEARQERAREIDKAEEMIAKDSESLAMNQEGQTELAVIEEETRATVGRHSLWDEPDGATVGDLRINKEATPVNTHQEYRLADGAIVPGVTTVLNILDKLGLPHWAWANTLRICQPAPMCVPRPSDSSMGEKV